MYRLVAAIYGLVAAYCEHWIYVPWYARRVRVGCWHAAWRAWDAGDDFGARSLYELGDRAFERYGRGRTL